MSGDNRPLGAAPELEFQNIPFTQAKPNAKDGNTYNFSQFPTSAQEDDENESTKFNTPTAGRNSSFWTFEYYQRFFDVDTDEVVSRVLNSMVPRFGGNFVVDHVRPKPDLYGPFWICSTLIIALAVFGNMSNYLVSAFYNTSDYHMAIDFRFITASATVIFAYAWILPLIWWTIFWWRNFSVLYSYFEMLCVYGYSLFIFIPVAVLLTIPIKIVQWLLILTASIFSGLVLVFTFWPAAKSRGYGTGSILISTIFTLHMLLGVGLKFAFFAINPNLGTIIAAATANNTSVTGGT